MKKETDHQKDASDVDYFAIPRFSNSALSNFKRSPRHYLYFKNTPKVSTPAMTFGSAFHCWVLENDKFSKQFFVFDTGNRPEQDKSMNSKINQTWKTEQQVLNAGRMELSFDEMEKIKRMHDSLLNHAPARELLDIITEVEKPILWRDDITGIEMKGKIDGCSSDVTLDLKTCMNAFPDAFASDAFNNAYHRQAALYMDGRGLNKMKKGDFYFVACEKEPPYGVAVMKCAKDFIEHGRMVYGGLLEDVRYWVEMGSPDVGYEWRSPFGYHDLHLPPWVKQ